MLYQGNDCTHSPELYVSKKKVIFSEIFLAEPYSVVFQLKSLYYNVKSKKSDFSAAEVCIRFVWRFSWKFCPVIKTTKNNFKTKSKKYTSSVRLGLYPEKDYFKYVNMIMGFDGSEKKAFLSVSCSGWEFNTFNWNSAWINDMSKLSEMRLTYICSDCFANKRVL